MINAFATCAEELRLVFIDIKVMGIYILTYYAIEEVNTKKAYPNSCNFNKDPEFKDHLFARLAKDMNYFCDMEGDTIIYKKGSTQKIKITSDFYMQFRFDTTNNGGCHNFSRIGQMSFANYI